MQIDRAIVERHLTAILSSPAFKPSKRCQEFLRFVVEESLSGRAATIKERTIATGVFGRGERYEPSEDSIVRVKAVEVRKRLASFYESGAPDGIHIELPTGTYAPKFHVVGKIAGRNSAPVVRWRRWVWLAALLVAVTGLGLVWSMRSTAETAMDRLWRPILEQRKPVLIAVPSPPVVMMTGRSQAEWTAWKQGGDKGLAPGVDSAEVRLRERYWVGLGAATGAVLFAEKLGRAGRSLSFKINTDISFTDLKSQPALLLGAFSAPWSMEMTQGLRYELNGRSIVETKPGGQRWSRPPYQDSELIGEDYALVTRLLASKSGQITMISAGMSPPGTEAGAEFLTREEAFAEFARQAPADWPVKNFQVVLYCKVHAQTPGPTRVVAWHVW